MTSILNSLGIKPENLGSHSWRKGATTYLCSGTTFGPSMVAIQIRAGWTLEGVTSRYLRYEAAGDQFVGRTVCGVPIESPNFGTLPPFFPDRTPLLIDAINACFPNHSANLKGVLEYCLASVIYHREWLRKLMPAQHPVFSAAIFRPEFAALLPQVVCRRPRESDNLRPTGPLTTLVLPSLSLSLSVSLYLSVSVSLSLSLSRLSRLSLSSLSLSLSSLVSLSLSLVSLYPFLSLLSLAHVSLSLSLSLSASLSSFCCVDYFLHRDPHYCWTNEPCGRCTVYTAECP